MTESERRMAKSLAVCRFIPGIPTKRFARDMAERARLEENGAEPKALTEKQAKYLREAVWKFRRQIPGFIVSEAMNMDQKLMDELYPHRPKP